MWIFFRAIGRRPFSSKMAMILPIRLRRTASGLMMEKVRSIAMAVFVLDCGLEGGALVAADGTTGKTAPPGEPGSAQAWLTCRISHARWARCRRRALSHRVAGA